MACCALHAAPPDVGHVLAFWMTGTLAARLARFLTAKLVCSTLLMRGTSALAGDFALALGIHCGKTAFAFTILLIL